MTDAAVAIGVLGPLQATVSGRLVSLAGPRQRALVALLALAGGSVVSGDRLVEEMWRDDATDASRSTLHVHVSNVRRAFRSAALEAGVIPADVVVTAGQGYALGQEVRVDAVAFVAETAAAARAAEAGDHPGAAALLRAALGRWRGGFLQDVPGLVSAEVEGLRLEEQRLAALEARLAADLECGRHAEVAAELEGLTRAYPVRESLWAQLMVALYRSGRQTDALRAYQRAREALADEAGVDPGPELQRLERSILAHSPRLAAPAVGHAQLAWFDGDRRLCSLRLGGRHEVRVGRRSDCDVPLVWDPLVSRAHAVFAADAHGWCLRDEGSRNGSTVNGAPIVGRNRLADGDVCRFGTTVVMVHLQARHPAGPTGADRFDLDGATLMSPEP